MVQVDKNHRTMIRPLIQYKYCHSILSNGDRIRFTIFRLAEGMKETHVDIQFIQKLTSSGTM